MRQKNRSELGEGKFQMAFGFEFAGISMARIFMEESSECDYLSVEN